ncbi:type II and III secretion system protein family protein [Ochrobactrum sp. Marseille-Q0166]|uniref:type II and III secretion system protein family protein n=1 Tax=Ochrobactrum sp. Marseille-Q0166 TaxID=2761105 RepID=UPI0016559A55|nr:type II and III secretion system protein family protein [Ochrobactrum sp. Marseille-Q0166]MBC8719083.1 type II and III secretion system protein family protein [Ochrobactrum sp. Marseille-Q0166]
MNDIFYMKTRNFLIRSTLIFLSSASFVNPTLYSSYAAADEVSVSNSHSKFELGLNQSSIIHLDRDVSDIIIANPNVANAVVRSARNIYLFGKNVGQTNIIAIDSDGKTISDIYVSVERDLAQLRQTLRQYLPSSRIKVALMNDNIVLSGEVDKASDIEQAISLASAFISGGEASVNQSSLSDDDNVGSAIRTGDAATRNSKIVNLIKLIGGQQVTLKVTIAEVSREIKKELGIDLLSSKAGFSFNTLPGMISSASPYVKVGTTLQAYLNAMEQAGAMKIVAEPTLTAISGETARFNVGGEYNVINSLSESGRSSSSLSLIKYGIGLEFLPVVLSPGRISLKVITEISEPNPSQTSSISGTQMIQLNRRNASSTIELPSGAAMMIAGLTMNQASHGRNAVPEISKLPVLGAMFRKDTRHRSDKELVIIVTPFLSQPTKEEYLSRPTDNLQFENDNSATFLGRINKIYGNSRGDTANKPYHGTVGYINK